MSIAKLIELQMLFRVKSKLLTKTFSKLKHCIKICKMVLVKIVMLKK